MKQHWILLTALLSLGTFYSCKPKEPVKKPIIIAVIPKIDNAIFDQVKKSSMQAAQELGIVVTWEAPTSNDGKKQKELIENLIKYKVDGILISCNDVDLLKEPINNAINAGIKVATFDSDCPSSNRSFYIGTDNRKAGQLCARTMTDLFKKANKKPDQILILSGGVSANNLSERLLGFKEVMKSGEITKVLYSFEMSDYGRDLMTYHLQKNKRINGLQMVWGVPALVGVDSIPILANFMKKGGISVFFDVSKPLLRYIMKNPNCATMKQDFHSMGYDGVMKLNDVINGKMVQEKILYDVKIIDQSNAKEELTNF